jgi:hypothetical protein
VRFRCSRLAKSAARRMMTSGKERVTRTVSVEVDDDIVVLTEESLESRLRRYMNQLGHVEGGKVMQE